MTAPRRAHDLVLAASLCAIARGGSVCFPAPNDASCLSWAVDGGNITFTASFAAGAGGGGAGGALVWGAWGLSGLDCGSMFPAHVWLALPAPGGGVRVEDRVTPGHAAPVCAAGVPQLSHTLDGSVDADGGFNVTWTRPLAPPKRYQQPAIAPGGRPVIGAYANGAAALPFPECSVSGLPFHSNVAALTVDFFGAGAPAPPAREPAAPPPPAAAAPARYSGLVGVWAVCGDACVALSHIAPGTGGVAFASPATPSLYPLLAALDPAARALHVLAFNNSGGGGGGESLFVASLDADSGALLGVCATAFPRTDDDVYSNLGLAFDAAGGDVLVAACTDTECVGPVNVTAVRPGTCATSVVGSVPAPALADQVGASALDPRARVLLFSVASGAPPALALLALHVETGELTTVAAEPPSGEWVQSLAYSDAKRAFYGLRYSQLGAPSLVTYDARAGGAVRTVGAVPGAASALPYSFAVSADGERAYFVGVTPGGGTALFAAFTANATVDTAEPLQYAVTEGDAPVALAWLP